MPESDEFSGGTLGASSRVAESALTSFSYSPSELQDIHSVWAPCKQWLDQFESMFPEEAFEQLSQDERLELESMRDGLMGGRGHFENLAEKFLRSISSAKGKSTPAMQRVYLQRLTSLAEEMNSLLWDVSIQDTPADIFAMWRRHGDRDFVFKTEIEIRFHLSTIQALASARLRRGLTADEEAIYSIKNKGTFERFKFATNAVQLYEASTGKQATAWVNETPDGRKCSEAVTFLRAVMNPVLKSVGYPPISADSARKEIKEVKRALEAGLDPGLYNFGSGSHSGV